MQSNFGDNRIQGREDQNHWNRKKKKLLKKNLSRFNGFTHIWCKSFEMFSKLRIKINNTILKYVVLRSFYLDGNGVACVPA